MIEPFKSQDVPFPATLYEKLNEVIHTLNALRAEVNCLQVKEKLREIGLREMQIDKFKSCPEPKKQTLEGVIRQSGEYREEFAVGLSDRVVIYPIKTAREVRQHFLERLPSMKGFSLYDTTRDRGLASGYNECLFEVRKAIGEA